MEGSEAVRKRSEEWLVAMRWVMRVIKGVWVRRVNCEGRKEQNAGWSWREWNEWDYGEEVMRVRRGSKKEGRSPREVPYFSWRDSRSLSCWVWASSMRRLISSFCCFTCVLHNSNSSFNSREVMSPYSFVWSATSSFTCNKNVYGYTRPNTGTSVVTQGQILACLWLHMAEHWYF